MTGSRSAGPGEVFKNLDVFKNFVQKSGGAEKFLNKPFDWPEPKSMDYFDRAFGPHLARYLGQSSDESVDRRSKRSSCFSLSLDLGKKPGSAHNQVFFRPKYASGPGPGAPPPRGGNRRAGRTGWGNPPIWLVKRLGRKPFRSQRIYEKLKVF